MPNPVKYDDMSPSQSYLLELCQWGPNAITMPSQRQVDREWHPKVPKPSDFDFQVVVSWILHAQKSVRAPMYAPPPTKLPAAPIQESVMFAEARIRSMSGLAALEECRLLGLNVVSHETNAGITAMRAKNALLHHLKKESLVC